MAKKKKGKRRRSYRKKAKRSSGPKSKPLGLAGGAALSGVQFATQSTVSSTVADRVVGVVKGTATLEALGAAVKDSATKPSTYKYAVAGMAVSAAPKIPLVKMFAGPVDRALKRLTKGKWGL